MYGRAPIGVVQAGLADMGEVRATREWAVPLVAALVAVGFVASAAWAPRPGVARAAATCDDRDWPSTAVTCAEAQRSVSLGHTSELSASIWLTTLGAVDEYFHPHRQVANHPKDRKTPVWVFVYEGELAPIFHANASGELVESPGDSRLLHVSSAADPATPHGAFVYLYFWRELGSPPVPSELEPIAAR